MGEPKRRGTERRIRLHTRITFVLHVILLLSVLVAVLQGQWLTAVASAGIFVLTLLPALVGKRYGLYIPPEFEGLAILFIFASLFLGEVRGYYTRFWWWDAVLHAGSGFLLGILGFLLVYVLNQRHLGNLGLRPGFVALFAFSFSVSLGALWEIFEFAMDQIFGLNMQKSGLVDTMWDLIVDAIGAGTIAILGYTHLKTVEVDSFLEEWIEKFLDGNSLPANTEAETETKAD